MTINFQGIELIYKARWRFEFKDRPAVVGDWFNPQVTAWSVNKDRLAYAIMEVKHIQTGNVTQMAIARGDEFINFEWVGSSPLPVGAKKAVKLPRLVVGISLLTRSKKMTFMANGRLNVRDLTEFEKRQHFIGFGS